MHNKLVVFASDRLYLAPGFGFEARDCEVEVGFRETMGQRAFDWVQKFVFATAIDQGVQRKPWLVLALALARHN
jgi:hypothetical protein